MLSNLHGSCISQEKKFEANHKFWLGLASYLREVHFLKNSKGKEKH